MCLYPRKMRNRKYIANKSNGGVPPPLPVWKGKRDTRVLSIAVGCGKCMECMKQKASEWKVRLNEEIRTNKDGHFVTMTLSEESMEDLRKGIGTDGKQRMEELTGSGYELKNKIASRAIEQYVNRWKNEKGTRPRRWLVTELGGKSTERIHVHGLIFTKEREDIERIWEYGHVFIGKTVNEATIGYIVKYLSKVDEKHPEYKGIMRVSPGMGKKYVDRMDKKNNEYKGEKTNEQYRLRDGRKVALPMYYRRKIYSEEEKEKLWLEKLDKGKRYVLGKEIDVRKGNRIYMKALKEAQNKNKRLGYGDKREEWEKTEYEKGEARERKWAKIHEIESNVYIDRGNNADK